ncbi:hypothetical protein EOD42_14090 [Rhodovarius crocodyli]|uniref:Phage gp6-like head-tail connector protein n=1 Tax=Rhodovarius crocodyli TaxID=1979269 RepID=A0A437MF37_9PROT|nr:hypothetical protein [Rhodovarius crocodyli]RVT96239.1 hypothetical protein EOD42_14090 [Rhodovarius crocodyli]
MPLAPYATLQQLQDFLSEVSPDASRQADLYAALLRASSAVEDFCCRDFAPGQRTESKWAAAPIMTPRATPVASIISATQDGAPIELVKRMGGSVLARKDGLPFSGEVEVTYTTEAPVPNSVQMATLLTAQAMADAPAYDQNAGGTQSAGLYSFSAHAGGAGSLPPAARALLEPLRAVFLV